MKEIQTIEEAIKLQEAGSLVGVFRMPEEVYRLVDAVNYSSLKELSDDSTPAHYRWAIANPRPPSAAMEKGTLWHTALLEPDKLKDRYHFWKEAKLNGATKEGKAQKAAADLAAGGKVQVYHEDAQELQEIYRLFKAHPTAPGILSSRLIEGTAFWIDEDTGLLCKCRPDAVLDVGAVFDIKTFCDRVSDRAFAREIALRLYHWQAAFYLDGLTKATGKAHNQFVWLAIEKSAPYGMRLLKAKSTVIEKGREGYKKALMRLKECRESGSWPGYPPEVTDIDLPGWFYE